MKYKVLFLDIDGTILKPDHTFSAKTKDAIQQVQQQGVEVFFATGRPLHELSDLAEQLNIQSSIGYNGGYAIYQNTVVVNEPIDRDMIKQYTMINKSYPHEIVFYTKEKNYFTTLDSSIVTSFIDLFQLKYNELFTEKV